MNGRELIAIAVSFLIALACVIALVAVWRSRRRANRPTQYFVPIKHERGEEPRDPP